VTRVHRVQLRRKHLREVEVDCEGAEAAVDGAPRRHHELLLEGLAMLVEVDLAKVLDALSARHVPRRHHPRRVQRQHVPPVLQKVVLHNGRQPLHHHARLLHQRQRPGLWLVGGGDGGEVGRRRGTKRDVATLDGRDCVEGGGAGAAGAIALFEEGGAAVPALEVRVGARHPEQLVGGEDQLEDRLTRAKQQRRLERLHVRAKHKLVTPTRQHTRQPPVCGHAPHRVRVRCNGLYAPLLPDVPQLDRRVTAA